MGLLYFTFSSLVQNTLIELLLYKYIPTFLAPVTKLMKSCYNHWWLCSCLLMVVEEASAENAGAPQSLFKDCPSCQMISTGLPFALAGYIVYHTFKNRTTLTGWQRTKLYIINGLFTTSKCFASLCTNLSFGPGAWFTENLRTNLGKTYYDVWLFFLGNFRTSLRFTKNLRKT